MDFIGKDNDGRPKSDYLDKVAAMDDTELGKELETKIWLSAYANNNPRSDYHWHVDAMWEECKRRDPEMYQRHWKKVYDENFG